MSPQKQVKQVESTTENLDQNLSELPRLNMAVLNQHSGPIKTHFPQRKQVQHFDEDSAVKNVRQRFDIEQPCSSLHAAKG